MVRALRVFVLLAAVAALTACEVKGTKVPPLAGPSELGLSLTIQASPDTISQDGASQSTIVVLARDANSQLVKNLDLRLDMLVNGEETEFGTLSGHTITTGSDGKATVVYTAPPSSYSASGGIVQLLVTPVGTDYANAYTRSVSIRVVPSTVIEPNSGAYFTVTPASPKVLESAILDGTASSVGEGRTIVSYEWVFGDGYKKVTTVPYTHHEWDPAGYYIVTLTITDNTGAKSTKMIKLNVTEK